MNDRRRDFDAEAASWDDHPARIRLASDVARAIRERIPLAPDMDMLDYGCGTGLLSLLLQPFVRSVTGVDASPGMLGVFDRKVRERGLANVTAWNLDLARGDVLPGTFHLVTSSMTLHHVKAIAPVLDAFFRVTVRGGHLCVADLDPEGGRFHGDNTGVFHFGFDRAAMVRAFAEAGYAEVRAGTAAVVEKPDAAGAMRRFGVFLVSGRKI